MAIALITSLSNPDYSYSVLDSQIGTLQLLREVNFLPVQVTKHVLSFVHALHHVLLIYSGSIFSCYGDKW